MDQLDVGTNYKECLAITGTKQECRNEHDMKCLRDNKIYNWKKPFSFFSGWGRRDAWSELRFPFTQPQRVSLMTFQAGWRQFTLGLLLA